MVTPTPKARPLPFPSPPGVLAHKRMDLYVARVRRPDAPHGVWLLRKEFKRW